MDKGWKPHRLRWGLFGRLRAYFLAGTLITAPIFITFFLAWWFVELVDGTVLPLIPEAYNPEVLLRTYWGVSSVSLPGLGIVIMVVFMTFVGALTAGYLGRLWVRVGESMLNRMPGLRVIYKGSKQILETVIRDQREAFRKVVLVEYPRKGLWAIAFMTNTTEGSVAEALEGQSLINVFLPTTPNPTSGFLLFVPKKDVVYLDISTEDAVKMVISAGIVTARSGAEAKVLAEGVAVSSKAGDG